MARYGKTIAIVAAAALIALSVVGVAYGTSKVAPASPCAGARSEVAAETDCPQAGTGCESPAGNAQCPIDPAGADSVGETQCPNPSAGSGAGAPTSLAGQGGCAGGCGSAGETGGASY